MAATIPARATATYRPILDADEQAATIAYRRMDDLGDRIVRNAKRRSPVRTGNLRSSITHRTTLEVGTRVRLSVSANARYAGWVHNGTAPHVIRARRAKALHFYWPRVGGWVFRKSVNHPGNAANPFLQDAVDEELNRPI